MFRCLPRCFPDPREDKRSPSVRQYLSHIFRPGTRFLNEIDEVVRTLKMRSGRNSAFGDEVVLMAMNVFPEVWLNRRLEVSVRTCPACGELAIFLRPATNNWLHFWLSVISSGLWLVGWLVIVIHHASIPWYCAGCGDLGAHMALNPGGTPPVRLNDGPRPAD